MNTYKIDPQLSYEGYIWYSDMDAPYVYNNKPINFDIETILNPFIIEGYLFNREKGLSISIRHVDGEHIIIAHQLNKLNHLECTINTYIPNRMPGVEKLCFNLYWRAYPDVLCEGMETLEPAELVFTGFSEFSKNK